MGGVEKRTPRFILAAALGLISAAGCGGGSGSAGTFTTSVPGEKTLGSLSDPELATLCADGAKFAAEPVHQMDNCRLAAFLSTALMAVFATDATDASLQMSCAETYNQCLNPSTNGGYDGGAGPSCSRPAANCAATVAEYTTCINDQAAETHAAASSVPACTAVSVSSLSGSDGGTASPNLAEPASCQLVQSKCSGLSEAAQTFITQYCAFIEPCCGQGGGESECSLAVTNAAQGGTYDATAGASCLAALTALQSAAGADFCGGLVVPNPSWAVIPACAPVFQAQGVAAAGQTCAQDSDCAPGPNGGAVCLPSFVTGDGGASTLTQTCQLLTGRVGDACFGTAAFGAVSSNPTQTGAICDQSKGVFCDDQTALCVPTYAAGKSCNSYDMCDPVTAYCNFSGSLCTTRVQLGATCAGGLINECVGNGYCNDTSKKCTALGGAGAACSVASSNVAQCLSGFCNAGACTNPLSPLCL